MGQMLVRNLDDGVIERLKARAAERGTSLEQVAREVLTAAALDDERKAWAERAAALRGRVEPSEVSSVEIIREWRDHDRMARLLDEQEWERDAASRGQ